MERVSATLGEVRPEAIAADVFHFVLVWEGGNGVDGKRIYQGFVEPDKIGEAAAD